jgi:hypothetical protein
VADQVPGGSGQRVRAQQAEADEEEAGVADRGVREQPLDVPLQHAHHAAEQRRRGPEDDQGRTDRGGRDGAGETRQVRPGHRVHAEFHHHAGEQHADGCRCHGVRVRQPEVEGHRGGPTSRSSADGRSPIRWTMSEVVEMIARYTANRTTAQTAASRNSRRLMPPFVPPYVR